MFPVSKVIMIESAMTVMTMTMLMMIETLIMRAIILNDDKQQEWDGY